MSNAGRRAQNIHAGVNITGREVSYTSVTKNRILTLRYASAVSSPGELERAVLFVIMVCPARNIAMNKFLYIFLLFFVSSSVNAFSGEELFNQCRDFIKIMEGEKVDLHHTFDAGMCGGYILGVREGFNGSTELWFIASEDQGVAPVSGKYWDVPDDVAPESIVKIVFRYLELNQDMRSRPAVLSVINALIQTYPAKKR